MSVKCQKERQRALALDERAVGENKAARADQYNTRRIRSAEAVDYAWFALEAANKGRCQRARQLVTIGIGLLAAARRTKKIDAGTWYTGSRYRRRPG